MPYQDLSTEPIFPDNPNWKTSGITYNPSRPGCAFDLKYIDYYVPTNRNIESQFKKEEISYNHFTDYGTWSHIENNYQEEDISDDAIPENGPLFKQFTGYGFNYSSPFGVGNPEHVWYTHTDLELNRMLQIRNSIRGPIVQRITEAKEYEDIYKICRSKKEYELRLKRHNQEEEDDVIPSAPSAEIENLLESLDLPDSGGGGSILDIPGLPDFYTQPQGFPDFDPYLEPWDPPDWDQWPPLWAGGSGVGEGTSDLYSGFTYDCNDYTCEGLKEKINAIPLECELIKFVLGEDWSGVDLNNYWWYGWLPSEWLENIDNDYGNYFSPYGGATGSIPNSETKGPPYQHIIGTFSCPDVDENLGEHEEDTEYDPVENTLTDGEYLIKGLTADACGCISDPYDSLPYYMTKCQFPKTGEKYPEYLEYVRSVGARYWDAPLKARLLRKAQMAMLFSQEIEFTAAGNLTLRVGDLISINFPAISVEENNPVTPNLIGGKWLVTKIKHIMSGNNEYKMSVSCARDNSTLSYIPPNEGGLGDLADFMGSSVGPLDLDDSIPSFDDFVT
jgi:hypothetical protein